MALRARLTKLETRFRRTQPDDPNASRRALIDTLSDISVRLTETEFSKAWCAYASGREIAGASWLEVRTGARSPVLWQNVVALSNHTGPMGKLFAALLDQANGNKAQD